MVSVLPTPHHRREVVSRFEIAVLSQERSCRDEDDDSVGKRSVFDDRAGRQRSHVPLDCSCITAHTNVPYSADATASLLAEGSDAIDPISIFADDRGCLVAKFDRDAVKGIIPDGATSVTLTLSGTTTVGPSPTFSGSDTVRVKE